MAFRPCLRVFQQPGAGPDEVGIWLDPAERFPCEQREKQVEREISRQFPLGLDSLPKQQTPPQHLPGGAVKNRIRESLPGLVKKLSW